MSQSKRLVSSLTLAKSKTPILSIIVLAAIFGVGLFVTGFENGQIIQSVFADSGIDPLVIHELTHDMRHAAGFPCH